jgi:hypothetical protein
MDYIVPSFTATLAMENTMELMAAHKHVIDAKSIEWCAKLSLAPERGVDLETWCEANCQAHFAKQGYDFFFEDQKDYKIFEMIWS